MKKHIGLLILLLTLSSAVASAADLRAVFEDAQRHFRRQDYQGAVELWTRVIESVPGDVYADEIDMSVVYYNRGLSYKRLHLWKEAADDFSMVIGFVPNDAGAFYERSGCYATLGLADKATADLTTACELNEDYCTREMLEQKKEKKEGVNDFR
jgi:tetratricopeptide (TPR) repeat protein